MKRKLVLLLFVGCLIFSGIFYQCGDTTDESDAFDVEIIWQACSLYEGQNDGRAECAEVQMPLFYDSDDTRTTPVYVKRLKARGTAYGQLWLLHGGPGASGVEDYGSWMNWIAQNVQGLDIYTLDHRGVGRSDRLGCPDCENPDSGGGYAITEDELEACIAYMESHWGDRLEAFTTTASARDVGELINRTREDDQMVFVYGGSYGTYWTNRYLQQFPEQADGIIIEGIVPGDYTFTNFDYYFNLNAEKFFGQCGNSPLCSSMLGDDPWGLVSELLSMIDEGHCGELELDRETVKVSLAGMIYYNGLRDLVPAMVHRLYRCNPDDIQILEHVYGRLFGSNGLFGVWYPYRSLLLSRHIDLSEMWDNDNPPSMDHMQDIYDNTTVCTGLGLDLAKLYDRWPKYQRDNYDDRQAQCSAPMLMLQGGIDPAAPIEKAQVVQSKYNGEYQTFVLFPYGAHDIIGATPMNNGSDCAAELFLNFLRNPNQEPDLSCVERVVSFNFNGNPAWANYIMGTTDIWGDGQGSSMESARDFQQIPENPFRLRPM